MLDVGWGDLIDYLADDVMTRSILIYMESIGDARSFLSAAREVALTKPIIVISDKFQRQGLGTRLLKLLVEVGKQEGLKKIFGEILPDNRGMLRVAKKVGFTTSFDQFADVMHAETKL